MPIYEFGCRKCRKKFDKITAPGRVPAAAPCPRCGTKSQRLVSRFAVAGATSKSGGGDDFGSFDDGDDGGDLGGGADKFGADDFD